MTVYTDAVVADSPVAYWRLNEAAGATTAAALVGTAATWINGTSESVPSPVDAFREPGNTASRFAGTKYLEVANPKAVVGAGSIEFWVDVNRWASGVRYGQWQNTTTWTTNAAHTIAIFRYENDRFYYRIVGADAVIYDIENVWTTFFVAGSGWNHVVCTYGAGNMDLYVNGVLKGTRAIASMPTSFPSTTVQPVRGHDGPGNGQDIDEFAVYDTVLSAARIKEHYDIGTYRGALLNAATSVVAENVGMDPRPQAPQTARVLAENVGLDPRPLDPEGALVQAENMVKELTPADIWRTGGQNVVLD